MKFRALSPLLIVCCLGLLRAEEPEGKPIFDGKSLEGWAGRDGLWKVEDGAITGETTEPNQLDYNTFLVWQGGEVDDFILEFDYRIIGGNSGVQIRSYPMPGSQPGEFRIAGYQSDIDSGDTYSGIVYAEGERGILANRGEKTEVGADHKPVVVEKFAESADLQQSIKKEDWNHYRIEARGHVITNFINGKKTAEVIDNDPEKRRRSGLLAIQLHKWDKPMKVQVKNITLKRLPLEDRKKVVFVAGRPSHGPGEHEHRAGCLLLADQLNTHAAQQVLATVYAGGWPADATAFDNADALVFYADGGAGHPINSHLEEIDAVMKRGAGLGLIHYAVETIKGEPGEKFLQWIGGYFEPHWSVNPHWTARYKDLPKHPVTRGVNPFESRDEWYYHMRFREDMQGVLGILVDLPPAETLSRPDGPHSGNPFVRKAIEAAQPQVMMWVAERDQGGRGFGFTGGHFHKNWAQPDFRKVVLNACLWIAKAEVPEGGVPAPELPDDYMQANLDPKGR